jgi:hypothetical protein
MELQDWTTYSPYLIPSLPIDISRSIVAIAAAIVWFVISLRIGNDGNGERRSCVAAHSAVASYHRQQQQNNNNNSCCHFNLNGTGD